MRILAVIMASATPADDVPGRNTSVSEEPGVGELVHHAGWPKVADAVIEAGISSSFWSESRAKRAAS